MELRIRRDGETARILKRLADQPAAAISKSRTAAPRRGSIPRAVKVGIVVPYSWSYWGAVPEHAELKAEALQKLGVETRTIIGHDPPGSFTRVLHPRHGRHGKPPADVIPIGRSVIVPANGALPNIILSPAAVPRIKKVLERAFQNGLILLSCGISTVRFLPPLMITREHVDEAMGMIEIALTEALAA